MARAALSLLACAFFGCGAPLPLSDDGGRSGDGAALTAEGVCDFTDVARREDGRVVGGPFVSRVVSFTPGPGATFGHANLPDAVLGPPQGAGDLRGGTDVVSLGLGGVMVLGFDVAITDGPGPDLTVFENPFVIAGREQNVWTELAEVSVSEDGVTWFTFPCDPRGPAPHLGCAGYTPVYSADHTGYCALDPRVSGGESFDLATVGLRRARFVRIRDLQSMGAMPPASGFDLDAVAVLHPG
jgi:hypothetical protein